MKMRAVSSPTDIRVDAKEGGRVVLATDDGRSISLDRDSAVQLATKILMASSYGLQGLVEGPGIAHESWEWKD